MPLINGQSISQELRAELKTVAASLPIAPVLDIILIGSDHEGKSYVDLKKKAIEEIGGKCNVHVMINPSGDSVISLIDNLNEDNDVHGILVQLPLPEGMDTNKIISRIDVKKDVDGFHPVNFWLLQTGQQLYTSCAPQAIMRIADQYLAENNPKVLLVGNSRDVIQPLVVSYIARGSVVTVVPTCDYSTDFKAYDLVVVEAGQPRSLTVDMFASESLVVDAGFHWLEDKQVGNIKTDGFDAPEAPQLLPVPGGLGPLLITMLLSNLVEAVKFNVDR